MERCIKDPRIILSKALQRIGLIEKDSIIIALDAGSSQTVVDNKYLRNNFNFSRKIRSEILNTITKFYL